MNKILYLHGFNSSPDSHKARVLHDYMKRTGLPDRIDIPEIPPVPADAIELLQQHAEEIIKQYTLSLVGSSLGGFYATWLAEKYNCPAVLINPAIKPHELLRKYLGENLNYYTDESWILDEEHIRQFRELYIDKISNPQRYLLMLQTGDETLDYREALEKYSTSPSIVEQGGSHEFSEFERHLDKILAFCDVT
jgi:predicted esterase YcpF (UPF0227 family)